MRLLPVSVYSSDAKLIPNNNHIITGEEGVADFINKFKTRRNFQVRYEDLDISLSEGGDMGYSIATVFASFQDTSGNQVNGTNRDLHIWKKENDEWKIMVDMWNEE